MAKYIIRYKNENTAEGFTPWKTMIFRDKDYDPSSTHTVTFNSNGGSPTYQSETYNDGEHLNIDDKVVSKFDYTFVNWQDSPTLGNVLTNQTIVNKDINAYAHYYYTGNRNLFLLNQMRSTYVINGDTYDDIDFSTTYLLTNATSPDTLTIFGSVNESGYTNGINILVPGNGSNRSAEGYFSGSSIRIVFGGNVYNLSNYTPYGVLVRYTANGVDRNVIYPFLKDGQGNLLITTGKYTFNGTTYINNNCCYVDFILENDCKMALLVKPNN